MTTKKPKKLHTILVIEDERPLVQVIQKKLEANGFDVITARTIDQGLDYLNEIRTIDAIWLDHYLIGDKTGLDLVIQLKSAGSTWEHIPIFVVSNTASNENLRSYIGLGVSKYCVKADNRLDEMVTNIKAFLKKGDK